MRRMIRGCTLALFCVAEGENVNEIWREFIQATNEDLMTLNLFGEFLLNRIPSNTILSRHLRQREIVCTVVRLV